MARSTRFLHGLSIGYATQALITIAGLWLTPFLLERIGQEPYGLWLVGVQVLTYLMLLDLGIVMLLPRDVALAAGASARGDGGRERITRAIATAMHVILRQWPFVALICGLVWILLPDRWADLRMPLGIVIATFVLTYPLRALQAILTGLQELAFGGITYVVAWSVSLLTTVGAVLAGFGLYALALGWVALQAITFAMGALRLARRHPGILPRRLDRPPPGEMRRHVERGAWTSLTQVAQVLVYGSDLLLIGAILGPTAVVPYSITAKLLTVFSNQPAMFMQMALPALSEMRGREPRDVIAPVMEALSQGMLIISGAVAVTVLAVNRAFIGWWVGPDLYGGGVLLMVLVTAILLRHWNSTAVYTMFAFGHERRISITTVADGAVTVVATVALLPVTGIIAAPIGSIVGVTLVSLPANLRVVGRDLGVGLPELVRPLRRWLWRFVALAAIAITLDALWHPTSFLAIAATALAMVAAYGIAMLPLAFRPPLDVYVRPRFAALRAALTGRRVQAAES